ncbi:DUF1653 domain-containing protein [Vermiphilus pyriformis]|jgi:hypothetical protein|uniref:DUF1653 domain-containing protein n=1 Tax=candidate division TM6 bacterium JCVI TM6SC1 TaxID=1306947 RepID=A0A0D2JLB7_9BACT|nr:hypothetical protein J120_02250 [candidate division TM6 bacterium JCVI TM6SC1]UNE35184.1 MAG: DUF1653 domain-containing protein [Vermiphilus pyriformis]
MEPIVVGALYQHYKGNYYYVRALGTYESCQTPVVIYQAIDDQRIWVRPLAEFQEYVNIDGSNQPRFAKVAVDIPSTSQKISHII